jgi:hypothetical protein
MVFGNSKCRTVQTVLICAWLSCIAARLQADFEIESFTRYRLIRLDNNNNGYVDDFDITDQSSLVENTSAADALEGKAGPPSELPMSPNSAESGSRTHVTLDTTEMSRTSNGSVHVAARIPNGFGFVDYAFTNPVGDYAMAVDYDDLHQFNVAFESLRGLSYAQGRGVQLENVIRFSPKLPEGQAAPAGSYATWEVFYGIRFYQLDDSFAFEGLGGILGRTWAATSVENQHGGPHLGMSWNLHHSGWTFALSGLAQGGLGATDSRQAGAIGEDLSPGQLDSPLFARSHAVGYQVEETFGTVYGEVRAQVKRELTRLITLTIGCSGYYFGDIKYADQSVNWFIPDLGLVSGTQDSTVTTAFAGLEFHH